MKSLSFITFILLACCATHAGSSTDLPDRDGVTAPPGMWLAKAFRIDVRLHARNVPGNYIDDGLDAITQSAPVFPSGLLNARVPGEATVAFVVSEDGTIRDIEKVKASVDEFAEASLQAVKTWRFKPIKYRGKPASLQVEAVFSFFVYYEN